MTDDQIDLIRRAHENLAAARLLLQAGHFAIAASRAYFAMFYVAQAFLEGEGLAFSKHSAVIAAFGEHFARPGKVPTELHRYLVDAEQLRRVSDYGPRGAVSSEAAEEQIDRAKRFLELAERLIGPIPRDEAAEQPTG